METIRTDSTYDNLKKIWAEHYPYHVIAKVRQHEDDECPFEYVERFLPMYGRVMSIAEPLAWAFERCGEPARAYRPRGAHKVTEIWDFPIDLRWDYSYPRFYFKLEEDAALFKMLWT